MRSERTIYNRPKFYSLQNGGLFAATEVAAMKQIAVTLEVANEAQTVDRAATPNRKERQ